jgi:hypothetical protein
VFTKPGSVELVGRYSNPDKWGHLSETKLALAHPEVDAEATDVIVRAPTCSGRPWPVVNRLGEQTVHQLLRDRRAGAIQRALAERYGISLSSVKRILRRSRNQ